jgi:hypothetical protein
MWVTFNFEEHLVCFDNVFDDYYFPHEILDPKNAFRENIVEKLLCNEDDSTFIDTFRLVITVKSDTYPKGLFKNFILLTIDYEKLD